MALALIAFSLLVILAIAGLVVVFVAFPHQGRDVPRPIPRAEWLTEMMNKASSRVLAFMENRPAHPRD